MCSQGNPASAGIVTSHLSEVARTLQGTVHNSYIVVDRVDLDIESQSLTNVESLRRIESVLSSIVQ